MSKLVFDIPSEICYMKSAVSKVTEYFNSIISICDDELFNIKVILNELIINSIKHGNNNQNITIVAGISKGCYVYIIIEDGGNGYNSDEVELCYEKIERKIAFSP